MIPQNVILFPFAGYGPEMSRGLAAITQDGRLVLTDAAGNPGTSVTNAIEAAADAAIEILGLDDRAVVLQWTPTDPVAPDSVWRVDFLDGGPAWTQVESEHDDELMAAVAALKDAVDYKERGR